MAAPNSFSAYRDTTAEREERRTRGSSAQLRAMEARRIALAQLRRTGMQKKARATAIKRENAMRDVSEKGVDSPDKPGRKDEPTRVGRVVASDPSASPDHQGSKLGGASGDGQAARPIKRYYYRSSRNRTTDPATEAALARFGGMMLDDVDMQ